MLLPAIERSIGGADGRCREFSRVCTAVYCNGCCGTAVLTGECQNVMRLYDIPMPM